MEEHLLGRRSFAMAVLALALVPVLSGPAAADEEAKRFIEGIYKAYSGESSPGVDFHSDAAASRYFTPDPVRLIASDRGEPGENGGLEADSELTFDPFV